MAEAAQDVAVAEDGRQKLDLNVKIDDVGPCKKHVRVEVARASIDDVYSEAVSSYTESAAIPGFRVGHVPPELIRKRFKAELNDKVKQRVLLASLEQLNEDTKLDPITEPNLDFESIEIPEEGNFEFEFDVEVRPDFELPKYKGLKIKRPEREISDKDVNAYLDRFREQYGKLVPVEEAAKPGDFVTVNIASSHGDKALASIEDISIRLRSKLRFQDAELENFDKFMAGAKAGDQRETTVKVSMEASDMELRGESLKLVFSVLDVKRLEVPPLDEEYIRRVGADSLDDLNQQIRGMLERQAKYEQRQSVRQQVLDQIAESAKWDLPEDLLKRQSDNAMRRETLELQQAGFTSREILARENQLRQTSLSTTSKNLKQHFVLDKIAETEEITVTDEDVNAEIAVMAMQSGENPRRVRARLAKSGMLENLEAQIRERKAVDIILDQAEFTKSEMPAAVEADVEGVNRSVCHSTVASDTELPDDSDE